VWWPGSRCGGAGARHHTAPSTTAELLPIAHLGVAHSTACRWHFTSSMLHVGHFVYHSGGHLADLSGGTGRRQTLTPNTSSVRGGGGGTVSRGRPLPATDFLAMAVEFPAWRTASAWQKLWHQAGAGGLADTPGWVGVELSGTTTWLEAPCSWRKSALLVQELCNITWPRQVFRWPSMEGPSHGRTQPFSKASS